MSYCQHDSLNGCPTWGGGPTSPPSPPYLSFEYFARSCIQDSQFLQGDQDLKMCFIFYLFNENVNIPVSERTRASWSASPDHSSNSLVPFSHLEWCKGRNDLSNYCFLEFWTLVPRLWQFQKCSPWRKAILAWSSAFSTSHWDRSISNLDTAR